MSLCPCGSEQEYEQCCGPLISGEQAATTAEALMRSRYSAYVTDTIGYLRETLHPSHRSDYDEQATRRWAENSHWLGLEIRSTEGGGENDEQGVVEFVAHFKEKGVVRNHHEFSRFSKKDGRWYYVDGQMPTPETVVNTQPKVGRNDPCPCGSGKKFKKCCGS
jgi:SEC-C motif-containing protein